MKKQLLLVAILIHLVAGAFAQEVELGIKGGMNISTLGSTDLGYVSRIGYHVGGSAEFITTPFFSIQTELMYSLQGAATDESRLVHLNYHYINIPLLAKAYFYEDASFEIGIQYGFLFRAVDKDEFYAQDLTNAIKKSDFSAVIGLAYKLNEKINLGVRYNLGLSNTSNQDIIFERRLTNRVLQIWAGYIF